MPINRNIPQRRQIVPAPTSPLGGTWSNRVVARQEDSHSTSLSRCKEINEELPQPTVTYIGI